MKIKMFAVGCCGALLVASACMLGACSNELVENDFNDQLEQPCRNLVFDTGLRICAPWHYANEIEGNSRMMISRASLEESASILHFFDIVDGSVVQNKTEKISGSFAVKLPFGVHQLCFLAHSSEGCSPDENGSMFSPSQVTETFLCNKELLVDQNTEKLQVVKMDRVVGKVAVKIVDAIPAGITALKLSLGNHCSVLDMATGLGVVGQCKPFSKEWNIGSSIEGRKGQVVSIMTFVPAGGITTSVKIEAMNAEGDVVYSREASNIPVEVNRATTASCILFKQDEHFSFEIAEEWAPGLDIDMEENEVVSKSETTY